jgi:hypothetical protein
MSIHQVNSLVPKLNKAVCILDGLSDDGSEPSAFEECLYQLGKVVDSIKFMRACYEDIGDEVQIALKALDELENNVEEKIKNPYRSVQFMTVSKRTHHDYT